MGERMKTSEEIRKLWESTYPSYLIKIGKILSKSRVESYNFHKKYPLMIYDRSSQPYFIMNNEEKSVIQTVNQEIKDRGRYHSLGENTFNMRFFYMIETFKDGSVVLNIFDGKSRRYTKVHVFDAINFVDAAEVLDMNVKKDDIPEMIASFKDEIAIAYSFLDSRYEEPTTNKYIIDVVEKFNFKLIPFFVSRHWKD
jgi:hypothetical protein